MQLLLFISALLAGLTGAFSADRAVRVGGQHGEAAITRAAEMVAETVTAMTEMRDRPSVAIIVPSFSRAFAVEAAPLALPARLTTGRRLE